jgi:predicted neuraminidase
MHCHRTASLRVAIAAMPGALAAIFSALAGNAAVDANPLQAGLVQCELIFQQAPFRQCHASTIAESSHGLVTAWFGGTREGQPDVGIWLSRREEGRWTVPVEVANGVVSSTERYPCWNPVLFQPKAGPLLLFYKMSSRRMGAGPAHWVGMLITSADGGRTWSKPRELPAGIVGPVKNKPVALASGELLCPSSTENDGWRVHFERTADLGQTWKVTPPVNDGRQIAAIQPSILFHRDGRLQALGRTRQGKIFETWSQDGGTTWGPMTLTALPNPNSGIDALTLADGRQLLVYNHSGLILGKWSGPRWPLNVAVSLDGRLWRAALVLESEPGEFSYPAVIQTADGLVHVTYTWKRQSIKHAVLDPAKLELRPIPDQG